MVWYKLAKPNQTATLVMDQKEEDECHKKNSLIESGWTTQQDMSKVEDNIALMSHPILRIKLNA